MNTVPVCAYCGQLAQGNFSLHRDGFGVGPEVPLCDACGSSEEPTLMEIWERIARPSDDECAFRALKACATRELEEWFAQ